MDRMLLSSCRLLWTALVLVTSLARPSNGSPLPVDPKVASASFQNGDYRAYISTWATTIKGQPVKPVDFETCADIAIAIDKSGESTDARTVEAYVNASDIGKRYLSSLRQAISGNATVVQALFADGVEPPPYSAWRTVTTEFKNLGYSAASNAFDAVLMTGTPGIIPIQSSGIVTDATLAWASIPVNQRAGFDAFMKKRIGRNWYLRQQIASAAVALMRDCSEGLTNALWSIADAQRPDADPFTIQAAVSFVGSPRHALAARIAAEFVRKHSDDVYSVSGALKLVDQNGDRNLVYSAYNDALGAIPEPQNYLIRSDFLRWLSRSDRNGAARIESSFGKLGEADAARRDEASARDEPVGCRTHPPEIGDGYRSGALQDIGIFTNRR